MVLITRRELNQNRFSLFLQRNRKKILIIGPIIGLMLIGGIIAAVRYLNPTVEEPTVTTKKAAPVPTVLPSLFNGLSVPTEVANRRAVAAMIENAQAARPQTGLTSADIVYEAVAEGGITRFVGIFSSKYPDKAGPVRSARSYFIDWLSEYDAMYVHAGGSPTALARIREYGIKDYPDSTDGTYKREPQAGVASEHTLYANLQKIYDNGVAKKKWSATHDFKPWVFKDPIAAPVASNPVTIDFSSAPFKVVWNFDATTNSYSRLLAGSAHKDKVSGEQITAKTIVVMTVQRSANAPYKDSGKESEWTMQTIGEGAVSVFQDGLRINGKWKKPARTERTRFYDAAGTEIPLNRGKIWVEVMPQTGTLSN